MGSIYRLNKNANELMKNGKLRKQFVEEVQDIIDEITHVNSEIEELEENFIL